MFRSLTGPYRIVFTLIFVCFAFSVVLSIIVGVVADIDLSVVSISFGFSLFGVYFVFRTASAYLKRIDEAASQLDLYMAVIAIFGLSLAYEVITSDNSDPTTVLWYLPAIPYWASRWIVGKKLNRLVGLNPSIRNIKFNALNHVIWMLDAPFMLRHTHLRLVTTDHP